MFQIWDAESANCLGTYDSEDAALAVVRHAIKQHGRDVIDSLALFREDTGVGLTPIAESSALADLALARTSPAA